MDKYLKKKLPGSMYFVEPKFMAQVLVNLGKNLVSQGFEKIIVITGHGGHGQAKALSLANKQLNKIIVINPYDIFEKNGMDVKHADEYETSLFWACYPEEEEKSRKAKLAKDDDYVKYLGYDPREKASLKLGNKMLKTITADLNL